MPMLSSLNTFVKICQSRQVFLYDLAMQMKQVQADLDSMYINDDTAYTDVAFHAMHDLLAANDESFCVWELDEDLQEEVLCVHLEVEGLPTTYQMTAKPARTGQRGRPSRRPDPVTRQLLNEVTDRVKKQATQIAQAVLDDMADRFPTVEQLEC
eukprot:252866-Chlamydomonas_euryale.AAC.1